MGNFQGGGNRGGGGFRGGDRGDRGGRPNFQKKSWGDSDRGDRPVTMHKATCSECGKSCEVPFRPTGDKPVYCNDCFGAKRDNGGDRAPRKDFGGNFGPKRDFADRSPSPINSDIKRQLNDVNMKLDKLINVIERMSSPKEKVAPKSEATQKLELETVIKKAIGSKSEAKPSPKKKVVKKKK